MAYKIALLMMIVMLCVSGCEDRQDEDETGTGDPWWIVLVVSYLVVWGLWKLWNKEAARNFVPLLLVLVVLASATFCCAESPPQINTTYVMICTRGLGERRITTTVSGEGKDCPLCPPGFMFESCNVTHEIIPN